MCGEPLVLVHYTGRPNSDWWAETLRELVSATLECRQRRHAIVHVEVFDPNVSLSPTIEGEAKGEEGVESVTMGKKKRSCPKLWDAPGECAN